jgi:hypothetical protein
MPPRLTLLLLVTITLSGCTGPKRPSTQPVYCYRTLADVGCYPEPDHGRERRLVGVWYRPAPDPGEPTLPAAP